MNLFPLRDTLGNSGFFEERTLTYAASPDAVKSLQVTATSANAVSASWVAPDANGSPITLYVIRVKDSTGATRLTKSVTGTSVKDLNASLVAGQSYSLEITAHNKVGGTETAKTTFTATAATYIPPAVSPFSDVSTGQQFYKEMAWLSSRGISTGWDNGNGTRSYKPLAPINRDAMAAFLYRMAGSPAYTPPAKSPFTDVSTKQDFYKEMSWLSSQGISTGWDNGNGTRSYKPLAPINRDAMAAFLYRMAGSPAYTPPAKSPFTDVTTGQQFYKEMAWL
ncbi:S-layer homology domain-containing protein, partial [Kocuria sp. SM24M-10]|uniref:S-layer homology domain-containing protein n=1 Tax=Kocuria sp. SM24M-10 TaxID=1660349 RepID=UPI003529BC74